MKGDRFDIEECALLQHCAPPCFNRENRSFGCSRTQLSQHSCLTRRCLLQQDVQSKQKSEGLPLPLGSGCLLALDHICHTHNCLRCGFRAAGHLSRVLRYHGTIEHFSWTVVACRGFQKLLPGTGSGVHQMSEQDIHLHAAKGQHDGVLLKVHPFMRHQRIPQWDTSTKALRPRTAGYGTWEFKAMRPSYLI